MKKTLKFYSSFCKKLNIARELSKQESGVAAVEFALIAPLLILLFLGTIETSYAVAVDRKLSRTSSAIADLVTQGQDFDPATIREYMTIANKVMAPYDTVPCIVITAIEINGGNAVVRRSVDNSSGMNADSTPTSTCNNSGNPNDVARAARANGSSYPVPNEIKVDGTWLVAAEIETDHSPIVGFFGYSDGGLTKDTNAIVLSDSILLRPRIGGSMEIN